MGGSNSKNTPKPTSPPNFQKDDMVQVAEGIQVGSFLLEKTRLAAEEQRLKDIEKNMDKHTNQIAQTIYNDAASKMNELQNEAGKVIKTKEEYIADLETSVEQNRAKFEDFVNQTTEKTNELKLAYENKITNLETILKSRGDEIESQYESYYNKTDGIFPVKSFNPVCQDRILSVKNCYAGSGGQTLHCSGLVDALKQCIEDVKKEKGMA